MMDPDDKEVRFSDARQQVRRLRDSRCVTEKTASGLEVTVMKMRSIAPMRIAKIGYVIMSLIFCLVGLGFILRADLGTQLLGTALGVAMIVFASMRDSTPEPPSQVNSKFLTDTVGDTQIIPPFW